MMGKRAGRNLGAVVCTLSCLPISDHLAAQPFQASVHFWLHAFIPSEHPSVPNYIQRTAKGTYVIPAPKTPECPSSPLCTAIVIAGEKVLLDLEGTCFTTDSRLFSSEPTASARMTVEFVARMTGRELRLEPAENREIRRIGETHNVDCRSGADLKAPRRASVEQISIGEVKTSALFRTVNIRGAAADPFYTLITVGGKDFGLGPHIDFELVVAYNHANRVLEVKTVLGVFPAFEAYYRVNGGPTQTAFALSPRPGSTAASLIDLGLGINTRNAPDTMIQLQ
jgi:hypothetical protein